jgi:transcriptional regulator with XRE-family HTH domain
MIFPNLSLALTHRGVRQFQLAARAEMSESALSRALSGRREFSAVERARVAEILGFDVEWLFAVAMLPTSASKRKELSSPVGARR